MRGGMPTSNGPFSLDKTVDHKQAALDSIMNSLIKLEKQAIIRKANVGRNRWLYAFSESHPSFKIARAAS